MNPSIQGRIDGATGIHRDFERVVLTANVLAPPKHAADEYFHSLERGIQEVPASISSIRLRSIKATTLRELIDTID